MKHLLLTIAIASTGSLCEAGYSEYRLLAPSACEAFAISTDAGAPSANAPDASAEYKAYVSGTKRNPSAFWALNGAPDAPTRWADCNQSDNDITCTVIGAFPFPSFTCRLGQSTAWSRSCTTADGKADVLKIYSVDTSEYELGGQPVINRYLQADLAKFDARCKKGTGRK